MQVLMNASTNYLQPAGTQNPPSSSYPIVIVIMQNFSEYSSMINKHQAIDALQQSPQ